MQANCLNQTSRQKRSWLWSICLVLVCGSPSWAFVPPGTAENKSPSRPAESKAAGTTGAVPVVPLPEDPVIAPASTEAERAISVFQLPPGYKIELFAAEPHVANPVSFCFDHQGRCYVAETFRQDQNRGVEDDRNHMDWLDEDLAAQTVEDRRAFLIRHRGDQILGYTRNDDRIRRLEDRDGDGRVEHASVFANHFNDIVDGTGASLLLHRGALYYTCIPRLWKFTDQDDDGVADERQELHYGYGVRCGFRGHDLHGLCMGPDGRVYFSIGDRGFNVTTQEGQVANPETGAVFRCLPDGSQLEIFAQGLRNPQELAFDDFGNLFTVDNNSDSGDQARLVQVVEGGDSGWRMAYQYLPDRGPWNREKLWHPRHEGQPAYIIPPIANMANGPSGLSYYPGTALPNRYAGHFFLCEFRGGATNSGILSFALEPAGATFKLIDEHQFIWSILPSDADFGPDGKFYIADWVHGWLGENKGRIYRLFNPETLAEKSAVEAAAVLQSDLTKRSAAELTELLQSPNQRVRCQAQWELASRGAEAVPLFAKVAGKSDLLVSRLNGIWGLRQLAREKGKTALDVRAALRPLLEDAEAEVRAQAALALGEAADAAAAPVLIRLLKDESPRVRFQAGIALGKLKTPGAVEPLLAMLRENDNQDALVRHAGVMGLAGAASGEQLSEVASDASPAARLAAVLALRRQASPGIAKFLRDADPAVVEEAGRAIHDLPIVAALPELASLASRGELTSEPLLHRVLNANFRLGTAEHAAAVAKFAARASAPEKLRLEALQMLADWSLPAAKDRVLNLWRPLESRSNTIPAEALQAALPILLTANDSIRAATAETAAKLGLREIGPELRKLLADDARLVRARVAALKALAGLPGEDLKQLAEMALADKESLLRAEGLRMITKVDPSAAFEKISAALQQGEAPERQAALAALGEMNEKQVDPLLIDGLLSDWLDRLLAGEVPVDVQLDLILAAERRMEEGLTAKLAKYKASFPADDPLAPYRSALAGGDATRGEVLFFERSQLSCVRCHLVRDRGGLVGPELTKIGGEKPREYLLEAIVDPNRKIAQGFQSELIALDDGRIVSGVLKVENDQVVKLMTPQGRLITVEKGTIDERQPAKSPMPEDFVKNTTLADLRDLVEYLASLKAPAQPAAASGK